MKELVAKLKGAAAAVMNALPRNLFVKTSIVDADTGEEWSSYSSATLTSKRIAFGSSK